VRSSRATWLLFHFSGSEENQDFEFFFDVVEAVFQFSLHKNDSPSFHVGMIGADLHFGLTT
jgi:hypothetical protein